MSDRRQIPADHVERMIEVLHYCGLVDLDGIYRFVDSIPTADGDESVKTLVAELVSDYGFRALREHAFYFYVDALGKILDIQTKDSLALVVDGLVRGLRERGFRVVSERDGYGAITCYGVSLPKQNLKIDPNGLDIYCSHCDDLIADRFDIAWCDCGTTAHRVFARKRSCVVCGLRYLEKKVTPVDCSSVTDNLEGVSNPRKSTAPYVIIVRRSNAAGSRFEVFTSVKRLEKFYSIEPRWGINPKIEDHRQIFFVDVTSGAGIRRLIDCLHIDRTYEATCKMTRLIVSRVVSTDPS